MSDNEAKTPKRQKSSFDPSTIELKWQAKWESEKVYQPALDTAKAQLASEDGDNEAKKQSKKQHSRSLVRGTAFYDLTMFPYPSAEGLHVGFSYTSSGIDAYARYKRMLGHEVFQPMGLDGFGIHSENHAIKTNTHPIEHAERTEKNFYRQLHVTGNSYAWDNKLETYDPEYYRWTQWLFVQLFKSGLAYKKNSPVNFCPSCKTVLSDEQVIDGKCERCDSVVEKRDLEQWFFKITKYAEQLLNNIETLDWSEKVKLAQKNWIGKSEGVRLTFPKTEKVPSVEVFTTAIDTVHGVTFVVISPEHPLLAEIMSSVTDENRKEQVQKYIKNASMKSAIDRMAEGKEKTGVFTGAYLKHPLTNEDIPLWVADYVLMDYGTGIVMGVPGHDARDHEFAQKFGLEIRPVIKPKEGIHNAHVAEDGFWEYKEIKNEFKDKSVLFNSNDLNGMTSEEAKAAVIARLEKEGLGAKKVTYHLRDWLISRQRYWGPPIPMIYCEACAKRKPKVLLIHGLSGSSSENWMPWAKEMLVARGYDVLIPDLPHADKPKLQDWVAALQKLGITKEDRLSIVAHSLGGPTAVEFIRQSKLEVEKFVLVAPTGKEQGEKEWEILRQAGAGDHGIAAIQTFNKVNESLSEIVPLVWNTSLYISDNDPYIPLSVEGSYKPLSPTVHRFSNHGHFNSGAGILSLPKLLDEFPEVAEGSNGWSPVPEKELPVVLPNIKNFKPLGTGKAPLANHPEFYETTCPHCGGKATRETDVSDTFLDSSWYFLRYLATDLKHIPFPMSKEKAQTFPGATAEEIEHADKRRTWLPVTMYIGGAEHSVLHLLYARFVTMALKDMGYVDFVEPFSRFYAHGLIIKDGAKMSKSKGNVINPDDYIRKYGSDTLRTYLLFLGPFDQGGDFRDTGIEGMHRFIKRVWHLFTSQQSVTKELSAESQRMMHEAIKGVTEEMENLRFNTSIARLMTWYNFLAKQPAIAREEAETYLKLLAPFAPHMTEELWAAMGNTFSIHTSEWPVYDEHYLVQDTVTIAVQVNGKLRHSMQVSLEKAKDTAGIEALARSDSRVSSWLEGKNVIKVIYVPGKILNFVVK